MPGEPERVCDCEVHCHVSATLPGEEEDVRWPFSVSAAHFLCRWYGCLHEHLKEGIAQGIMPPCAAVLVATHKMVPKRVHQFSALGAPWQGDTEWEQGQTEPPSEEDSVVCIIDVDAHGTAG